MIVNQPTKIAGIPLYIWPVPVGTIFGLTITIFARYTGNLPTQPDNLRGPLMIYNGHTCITDDGGTPNRRCLGCEEETRMRTPNTDPLQSSQPCGCDPAAKWPCERHRSDEEEDACTCAACTAKQRREAEK